MTTFNISVEKVTVLNKATTTITTITITTITTSQFHTYFKNITFTYAMQCYPAFWL